MKAIIVFVLLSIAPVLVQADEELLILTEENPPLNYTHEGEVTGYVTEIVQRLLQATGNSNVPIEVYPWARAYKMAQERANVLLYTTARIPSREAMFKWVGPVAERNMWVWKLKGRGDIQIKNLDDAKRYSFSIVPRSAGDIYLSSHGFTEKQLDYMPHDAQTMRTFLLGRNDFVLKTRLAMSFSLRELGESGDLVEAVLQLPSNGDYYLAFSKETPDTVVAQFQQAMDALKASGEYAQITSRWVQ